VTGDGGGICGDGANGGGIADTGRGDSVFTDCLDLRTFRP
jgi:hypothetical protein